ncbi:hypothetical protein MNL01_04520 [Bartonella krasnovii]|uniref:hypothetical protein n=1 Tax=Bartonella krasnovii TaxID=2267275 RepID=UPI001F4D339A|nr:hypothetical protein [Bartonella krasnovii]UNF54575.1 hypothetical protein MNL01_04520 [Bartonella krasnovii]
MTDASTTASAALTTANDAKRIAEAAKTSSGEAKILHKQIRMFVMRLNRHSVM